MLTELYFDKKILKLLLSIFPKQETFKHNSRSFESWEKNSSLITRKIYIDAMKFRLKHVSVRQTGIVIQPLLYWLAASPDWLITDKSGTPKFGLIEIKCPFSKRNLHTHDMLEDKNFYVELRDGMPHLKEEHSNGYHSQIQMTMGLSQLKFCDFIVYSFKGMIIILIPFGEIYFIKLTKKLKYFFKNFVKVAIFHKNELIFIA